MKLELIYRKQSRDIQTEDIVEKEKRDGKEEIERENKKGRE